MRLAWCLLIASSVTVFAEGTKDKDKKANEKENKSNEIITDVLKTKNVNKTIAKVEAILTKNPQLPRLTRGEIVALLENITKTDALKANQSTSKTEGGDKEKREEKSLLVVLPFIPYNESGKTGLEELYTKEPMTRLIMEVSTPLYQAFKNHKMGPEPTATSTTPRPHKRRRKPPMKPIVVAATQEQRPVYVHKTRTTTTTQPPPESSSESDWKPYTAYDSPSILTQRPSTVSIPLPERMRVTLDNLNLPKNHKPEGQPLYVTLPHLLSSLSPMSVTSPVTTTKRPRKKTKPTTTTTTPRPISSMIAPISTVAKAIKAQKTTPMPDISVAAANLTPDMKLILGELGLMPNNGNPDYNEELRSNDGRTTERITPFPSPVNFKPLNPTVDPSSYVNFKPIPDKADDYSGENPIMDSDMKQILANFGLLSNGRNKYDRMGKSLDGDSDEETEKPKAEDDQRGAKAETKDKLNIESDTNHQSDDETNTEVNKRSNESSTKSNFTLMDINTDVLSDEMKDMLEDLGVLKPSISKRRNGKGHIFNPVTQSALLLEKPEEAERISKVLTDIKKLSEDNKTHHLNPEEIRAHLQNITSSVLLTEDSNSASSEQNVNNNNNNHNDEDLSFSQSENEADNDQDRGIIFGAGENFDGYEPDEEELLRIQNNHNGDISPPSSSAFFPDSSEVADKPKLFFNNSEYFSIFNKTLQQVMSPPDPLSLEELHQLQDLNKNEVKRQQPENTTSAALTTEASDISSSSEEPSAPPSTELPSSSSDSASSESGELTTTTTTTSAPDTTTLQANIKDLEDSFGGETPLVRPNGLYFLLDWNSFLRVGQENRTVNLSFSPKVGDPRNFIQVNVP